MTDTPIVQMPLPTVVPGMRITYERKVAPDATVSFELADDATASYRDLYERLAPIDRVARTLAAIEELPRLAQLCANYREKLREQQKQLDSKAAEVQFRHDRQNAGRRNEVPLAQADINTIEQYQKALEQTRDQIRICERRIPYLQALIRGEDIAEPIENWQEAAE